ncbi:MAG: hypothetical protein ACKPH7_01080 [Planktothrix sp.]|uniref:hypothetical protein n=1 Tax=Planktothrix sp. TaxID=3088171 RepID=UPI0038D3F44B
MDNLREQLNMALATPSTPPPELKSIIEKWRKQSKPTRDWTKANQLLEELNKLIS